MKPISRKRVRRAGKAQKRAALYIAVHTSREVFEDDLDRTTGGTARNSYDPYKDNPLVRWLLEHPGQSPNAHLD